jgi:hypothetical protein
MLAKVPKLTPKCIGLASCPYSAADLAVGDDAWERWKGRMPQLLDEAQPLKVLLDE